MIPCEVNTHLRTFLFFLLLGALVTLQCACEVNNPQPRPATFLPSPATDTSVPQDQAVQDIATEAAEIIPVTALENLEITSCPDWDLNKMYEYGEYIYGRSCAGCHGRQGQGVPVTNHFPPLNTSGLAVSEDISDSLLYMMNTDIHPNATMLFEKDALAVINYVRITFASNTDIICPGEYVIKINP